MDHLEQLSKKVTRAAHEILGLKKENRELHSQIELLKEELQKQKALQRDNETFQREQTRLRTKLERIRTKIEKAMTAEPALNSVFGEGGARGQEHDE